jgi:hypothetical protein
MGSREPDMWIARGWQASSSCSVADDYPCLVLKRSTPILLAVCALAAAPSAAFATSADVAATRVYVRANYALVHAARANLREGQAAIRSFVREITGHCPKVAAGSPGTHDAEQLNDEVIGALYLIVYRQDVAPIHVFARAVRGLHWSNPKLTRTVERYASKLEGVSTLAMPNVCGDVEAWAASGFRMLSEGTARFDRAYFAVDVEAEEVPLRQFAPYEGPVQVSLLHRTKQLEAPLADAEAKAVGNYMEILDALELNQ